MDIEARVHRRPPHRHPTEGVGSGSCPPLCRYGGSCMAGKIYIFSRWQLQATSKSADHLISNVALGKSRQAVLTNFASFFMLPVLATSSREFMTPFAITAAECGKESGSVRLVSDASQTISGSWYPWKSWKTLTGGERILRDVLTWTSQCLAY